ncbi:LysR family transcriptional regulator [Xylophilus rhododendri]|uniref:LysR family transcriptional regulator n=1 Tax=Xylophilus rhododendri TaxID=2697032 RepID=A0A857JF14_9BURK|nr:LysR family transcriptional regulator [Xylophilus rhododendri]QHJ01276.1 LysR family transcriptional regulator [Xylophilus rhododendri]
MKWEAFATLDAVLRTGTLAAAAKETNLTAGAVGLQMKQLEAFVGHQLFDRSGLQVKPLPLAGQVAAIMRRAQGELDVLRRPASIVLEGPLELGVIESMQPLLLPGALQALRRAHPGLRVHPHRGKSAELTHAVKAGNLDAAVVAQPEQGASSRLDWHALMHCPLSLVVPPDAPAGASPAALFQRYEWIQYDRASIAGRLAARYLQKHFKPRAGGLELDGVRAVLAMVNAGLGLSMVQLSEPGIALPFPVRVIALPQAPVIRFSLVSRSADALSRPLAAVREALGEAARERGLPG